MRRVGLKERPAGDFALRIMIRTLLFGVAVGAAFGAALTGPAMAEEQLVMPFACRVAGGQVLLAPSAPQTYQIYGRREHKQMTTCSPYDPRKCHNWAVHRFDLDCGGARTSWQSVVAALSPILAESAGNAYDGPYDAPAYGPPGGGRPYRSGPRGGIAFPPGFAPNPMKVAHFNQIKPAPPQIALPDQKPVSAAPAQVAEVQPSPKPAAAKPAPAEKAKASNQETAAAVAQKPAKPVEHRALQIEVESGSGDVTGSLPKSDAASGSLWRDAALVFAVTLTALLVLSALLLLRRGGMLALPMPPSLRMPMARLFAPATQTALARASHAEPGRESAPPSDAPATRLRLWDEGWLPGTMSEALDVLGVDPDASRDMMKTTVTRLRRALHPDHAIDEEDRLLRERRLKQINVAWEIVCGKRRAPWLKAAPRSA